MTLINKSIDQIIEDLVDKKIDERLSDRYMSFEEVRKEFGCSRTWIYRRHGDGHLNIYKLAGKSKIKRSEIERLAIPK